MVGTTRALALALLAITYARATLHSHDNILRVQLWDAEGLSREPFDENTQAPQIRKLRKSKVDPNVLYNAMLEEDNSEFGRYTRHKVRHKRRRTRQVGPEQPWRFHDGSTELNVVVYDNDVNITNGAVSESGSRANESRPVGAPLKLRQDEDEVMSESKQTLKALSQLSPPEVVNSHSGADSLRDG